MGNMQVGPERLWGCAYRVLYIWVHLFGGKNILIVVFSYGRVYEILEHLFVYENERID